MATQTANYSWDKPDPGGDKDVWGTLQNGALDGVDTQVKANEDAGDTNAAAIGVNAAAIAALEAAVAQLLIDVVPAIGEILVTSDPTDPVTRYPGTTWVALEGVVLVGVGTSPSVDAKVWALDQQEGNETHQLTSGELAVHDHGSGSLATASDGAHTHNLKFLTNIYQPGQTFFGDITQGNENKATTQNGNHSHNITGRTGDNGNGNSHNNLQPTLAKHIWERTA